MSEATKAQLLTLFQQMQLNFEPVIDVKIWKMTIEDRPDMTTFRLRTRAGVTHLILVPSNFTFIQEEQAQ